MAVQPKALGLQQKQYLTPGSLGIILLVFLSLLGGYLLTQFNPVIVIGVVGITVLLALLFFSPYLGVLVYLVFEYARLSAMFPALQALQIGKLIVMPTLVMLLIHAFIMRDHKLIFDRVLTLFLIFVGIALVGAPFASQTAVWIALFDLVKWFIICFVIVNLVRSVPKFQYFVWLLLLLNLKMSQHQIRAYSAKLSQAADQYRDFIIQQGVGAGSTSFFANATDFGFAMVVVVPLALYLIPSVRSKLLKVFAGIATGFFVTSILKSGSRGAAVAMFAMAALYWFKSKQKLVLMVVLAIFMAVFWAAAPDAWKDRFVQARDYEEDTTAMQRIDLWKAGIAMFLDHPFTGVGVNQYGYEFESGYRPGGYNGASVAHNIFIQAAAELGVGGIFLLLAMLFMLFLRNMQTRKIYKSAGLDEKWIWFFSLALDLSLVGFIVGGFFLTVLYYPHLYMILSMILALHHITRDKAEKASRNYTVEHV